MPKWILPHDEMPVELVNPTAAKPNWILPHSQQDEALAKTPEELALEAEPPVQQALIGAGSRLHRAGQGAKQAAGMVRNLFPGQPSTWPEEVAAQVRENAPIQEAIAKNRNASLGALGTDVALGMMAPGARVLPAAAAGFALEGPLTPRAEPSWGDMLQEGGKGALLSAASTGALNTLMSAGAKGKNALAGRFADPNAERRLRIFRQNQVPASLGDITQSPTIMALENAAQHIPLSGRKEFLENQATALGNVVEGAPTKIAGITSAQSKEAVGDTLARSIKRKYAEVKDIARGMYDEVETRVQALGNPPVTPTKMSSEVQALLSKYPSAFSKIGDDPQTVKTLEMIATGVQPGKSPLLNANGLPIMKAPNLTFSELRQLDSDLGAMIRQGRQLSARGEYGSKTFDQLVKVQKALREDITDWSKTVGDPKIASGISEANKYFKDTVIPFRKNQVIRKVIQDDQYNPDTLASQFFKLDSPYLAERAREFMTPEGVQAGRFYLINEAKKRAMNDVLESGYSPSKFMRGTELGETGPKLFTPEELGQLGDLQELIGSSRRAATYAADPSTGNRLLALSPLASWKVPGAARLFSTATQSEGLMRYMLADPRLYTGTGPLGMATEELLRKSGVGFPLNATNIINDE